MAKLDRRTIESLIARIRYDVPRSRFQEFGQNLPKSDQNIVKAKGAAIDEIAVTDLTVRLELLKRGLKPIESDDGQ